MSTHKSNSYTSYELNSSNLLSDFHYTTTATSYSSPTANCIPTTIGLNTLETASIRNDGVNEILSHNQEANVLALNSDEGLWLRNQIY